MEIYLNNPSVNLSFLMRRLGYHPDKRQKPGFLSFSRRLTAQEYPKFHVYASASDKKISLHLDMKKPSYKGSRAHSGEYHDNDWILQEAQRIKDFLLKNPVDNQTGGSD